MSINSDFILVRPDSTGVLWYWCGRHGWSNHPTFAVVYARREQAEAAIKRQQRKGKWIGGRSPKYCTRDEALDEFHSAQESAMIRA